MKRHIARGAFVAASLMTTLAFAAPAEAVSTTNTGLMISTVAIERGAVTPVGGRYYGRHGFRGGFRHHGFYGRRHFGHRGFGFRRHGFHGHRGYYGHRKFHGHGFRRHHSFKHHGHGGFGGKKFFFGFKH